jgi:hypothetical protein
MTVVVDERRQLDCGTSSTVATMHDSAAAADDEKSHIAVVARMIDLKKNNKCDQINRTSRLYDDHKKRLFE